MPGWSSNTGWVATGFSFPLWKGAVGRRGGIDMASTSIGAATQRRNEYPVPSTMRAWVLGGPEELSMVEKQVPKPGPAEVLVRVDAIAVCATDIEIMKHGLPAMVEGELPFNKNFTIGHEYMGTIVRLGPSVDEFHIETGSRSWYMPGAAAALAAARVCIRRALTTV